MAPVEVESPAGSAGMQGRLTVSMLTATAIVVADMVGVGVFTSLGFQVHGHPVRLLAAAAVGRRRRRRAVRGVLLRRTRRHVSPLQRRVQFPARKPSIPAARLPGRAGCRPPSASRPRWRSPPWRSASTARRSSRTPRRSCSASRRLDRLPRGAALASTTAAAFQMGWTASEGGADPRVPGRGICAGNAAADLVRAVRRRRRAMSLSAPFAISLVFVMYSYSGWNAATYITGEMTTRSAACRARCCSGPRSSSSSTSR